MDSKLKEEFIEIRDDNALTKKGSTPNNGLVNEFKLIVSRPLSTSFLDEKVDINDISAAMNLLFAHRSYNQNQMNNSQLNDCQLSASDEIEPRRDVNGSVVEKTSNEITKTIKPAPMSNELIQNKSTDAPPTESIDINPSNSTITECHHIDPIIDEKISDRTTAQCNSNTMDRQGMQQTTNQRRKRKMAGEMSSSGNSKKMRKIGLHSTLRTIPVSSSGKALN